MLKISLLLPANEKTGIGFKFLDFFFPQNPSFRIAISGRADRRAGGRRPRFTFWLTFSKKKKKKKNKKKKKKQKKKNVHNAVRRFFLFSRFIRKSEEFDSSTHIKYFQIVNRSFSLLQPMYCLFDCYPQSIFLSRNKKNNVYPGKPQFYYIKVGFKGVKIIQACFRYEKYL